MHLKGFPYLYGSVLTDNRNGETIILVRHTVQVLRCTADILV